MNKQEMLNFEGVCYNREPSEETKQLIKIQNKVEILSGFKPDLLELQQIIWVIEDFKKRK